MALWVSLYEPLLLFAGLLASLAITARAQLLSRPRRIGWCLLGVVLLLAALVEQRWPQLPDPALRPFFVHWSATIGELSAVSLTNAIWLQWFGALIVLAPALLVWTMRRRTIPAAFVLLFALTFLLTIWQARWGYFFVMIFALVLPACLSVFRNRIAGWIVIAISWYPILKDWDERLWPNEFQTALIAERRAEGVAWRQAAAQVDGPFLAPWWWSPAVAYWSGQPGVAGSSHEALDGIEKSARFFLASDPETAQAILQKNEVAWVLAYDADRTVANSALVLGVPAPANPLGRVLDRTPSQAPGFLQFAAQNPACKLFRVHFFQEKENFPR